MATPPGRSFLWIEFSAACGLGQKRIVENEKTTSNAPSGSFARLSASSTTKDTFVMP